MMTVGGCVAAFWLALAIAPVGFCIAAYVPPARDFTVTAPLLEREPSLCAQDALPAAAGVAAIANARLAALRPD